MIPSPERLRMTGICKRFGATVALQGVGLEVAAGEVHALVGENGAGKSTLMKILSGAVTPDAGEMFIDGKSFAPRNPLEARCSGVAMIYQELSLASHLTVEQNILLGMEPSRWGIIDARAVRQRAREALAQLHHSDIDPSRRVAQLGVADRQIVEIARALAVGCRVLVLDEPTSSLSGRDVERLFELIGRLKGQGQAIVYISHFLEEVQRVSDRVTVLRDGRVVGSAQAASLTPERIVTMMVGRDLPELYHRSKRTPREVVLELADLAGAVKPISASLELRRGEVLGIAGLVGAGRTELLRCLFGLEPIRRGRVRLGTYVGPASPARRWAQGAGLLSEDRKNEGLATGMSIADNVTMSRLQGFGPAGLVLPGRQDRAARRWVQALGIRCRGPRQVVAELSGGNQQKVAIARLLQHDVDVLLLDEPTRGVDVGAKATIYRLIDSLATGPNPKAVLIVSSYLPELTGLCDRVAVMSRGRLGPARPADQVTENQLLMEAIAGDNPA